MLHGHFFLIFIYLRFSIIFGGINPHDRKESNLIIENCIYHEKTQILINKIFTYLRRDK